jgi:type I restriction enzyme S subunit
VPGLNREDAYRQRLLLPPVEEQRRLAGILGAADGLRAEAQRTGLLSGELVHACFVRRFGEPRGNREGWPQVALGELTRVIRGASPRPAGDPRFFGGGTPWLKISDVTAARGRYVTSIEESVTEEGVSRSVLVDAGSLILTNSATVGIPKFLARASCIHDGFLALLDPDPERVHPLYLYTNLLLRHQELVALALTGTQKNLNTGIVKGLSIPLPPIEGQRSFAAELEGIERLSDLQARRLDHLDVLAASLQARAFSGRL